MSRLLLLLSFLPLTVFAQQKADSVILGAQYMNQVWYSMANGIVHTEDMNNWDLAFEASGHTAAILVNTQKGLSVFQSPYAFADWDSFDTTGLADWTALYNSDTTWSTGALNHFPSGDYDLGWGMYNMTTHVVQGDSVFVLQFASGDVKKLRIDVLSGGVYTFTYADIDGSNSVTASIRKSDYTGKNFGYYSIENNTAIDREPMTTNWDITFTKYTTFVPIAYSVTGVLSNAGVACARVEGMPTGEASLANAVFSTQINTIGYDWKSYSFSQGGYSIADSVAFFVRDQSGDAWKVVFTEFEGSATGKVVFTIAPATTTSVTQVQVPDSYISVYPHPIQSGNATLIYSNPGVQEIQSIRIYNSYGALVWNSPATAISNNTIPLSFTGVPSGVYHIQAVTDKGILHKRVIVQQ